MVTDFIDFFSWTPDFRLGHLGHLLEVVDLTLYVCQILN